MSVLLEILYSWPGNFSYSHLMTISLIDKPFKDQRDLIHQISSPSEKPNLQHLPKTSLMLLLLTVASWSLVPWTQEPSFWPRACFGTVYFNPPTRVALPRQIISLLWMKSCGLWHLTVNSESSQWLTIPLCFVPLSIPPSSMSTGQTGMGLGASRWPPSSL